MKEDTVIPNEIVIENFDTEVAVAPLQLSINVVYDTETKTVRLENNSGRANVKSLIQVVGLLLDADYSANQIADYVVKAIEDREQEDFLEGI